MTNSHQGQVHHNCNSFQVHFSNVKQTKVSENIMRQNLEQNDMSRSDEIFLVLLFLEIFFTRDAYCLFLNQIPEATNKVQV